MDYFNCIAIFVLFSLAIPTLISLVCYITIPALPDEIQFCLTEKLRIHLEKIQKDLDETQTRMMKELHTRLMEELLTCAEKLE